MSWKTWRDRIGESVKAVFSLGEYGGGSSYAGLNGNYYRFLLPGSQIDYQQEAGPTWLNGCVSICLSKILLNFLEPTLQVVDKQADGTDKPVPVHPLLDLLETPNSIYDFETLVSAALVCMLVDGNGYWVFARDAGGVGDVREIYFAPFWQMTPKIVNVDGKPVKIYERRISGKLETLAASNVLHFKYGVNPENPLEGLSPLKTILRELVSDNEAATYTVTILRNLGVVAGMVTPDGDYEPSADDIKEFKRKWRQNTGDSRASDLMVPHIPMKYARVGATPEELALDRIQLRPEARIHGALGVPAMVTGLNVGDAQKTYANYGEARKAFNEDCLIPLQTLFAKAVTKGLLRVLSSRKSERVAWDYSQVRSMQPDRMGNMRIAALGYSAGILQMDEARSDVGKRPIGGEEGAAFKPAAAPVLSPASLMTDAGQSK